MKASLLELLGSRPTLERLENGVSSATIASSWAEQIEQFRQMRKKYLIYPGD